MGEDKDKPTPPEIPQAGSLEKETVSTTQSLADIEQAERRVTHVTNTIDSFAILRDIKFEKYLFAAGIGLLVTLFIIVFILFNSVEDGKLQTSLASQVESDFYATLLKDKDYVFNYELDEGVFEYDPLLNISASIGLVQGLTNPTDKDQSGFFVKNTVNAQLFDANGTVILELGDTAIYIDDILLAPDGNSVIFDVRPANSEAENKFGLRLGAYEYRLGDEDFETLVSDASPGINDESYRQHFIQVLSFSPNGRYLAYTNRDKLFLFDRLSSASINIAQLDYTTQEPATSWTIRPDNIPTETSDE